MRPRKPSVPRIAALPPAVLAGGALTIGAGGLYLAGLLVAGGEIEDGTTVRGVDIGGLSRSEAVRKLEDSLPAAGLQKITVRAAGREDTVETRQAGLAFDAERTVDRAARSGLDPVGAIGGLFRSGGTVEPVVQVDEDKARSAVGKLAKTYDRTPRDGGVAFGGGKVWQ
ncbi:peptidoglycan binding domain-containing protein, partial [Streptomyces pharetrae]|uniref:peptidoglycan binding domain-containing protein n=1 Tax=Streptomyces pharetrae TaxID=291370 RepID=UPI0036C9841D